MGPNCWSGSRRRVQWRSLQLRHPLAFISLRIVQSSHAKSESRVGRCIGMQSTFKRATPSFDQFNSIKCCIVITVRRARASAIQEKGPSRGFTRLLSSYWNGWISADGSTNGSIGAEAEDRATFQFRTARTTLVCWEKAKATRLPSDSDKGCHQVPAERNGASTATAQPQLNKFKPQLDSGGRRGGELSHSRARPDSMMKTNTMISNAAIRVRFNGRIQVSGRRGGREGWLEEEDGGRGKG